MKWLELGSYRVIGDLKLQIALDHDYEKALTKLDLFSHCLLFFLHKEAIDIKIVKIEKIDTIRGVLDLELLRPLDEHVSGQLIDIKPYFPIEEIIKEAEVPVGPYCLNYNNNLIGDYCVEGHSSYIQLKLDHDYLQASKAYEQIREGAYVRILWWFHRFDKDRFRKNRMCNPPYNHAPKSGIFATRSPVRPNPIASTLVKVRGLDRLNHKIEIQGFDGFPGSEILQIMSYDPSLESVADTRMPPWIAHWTQYKDFREAKAILEKPIKTDFDSELVEEEPDILSMGDQGEEYLYNDIHVRNAHIHNLKHISLTLAKNEITLITGVSGSGKSSLAFDTLFAESQKLFMDLVLSNQMLAEALADNHVEKITGLQPAIAIRQKNLGANPRSTVASVTRIADLIRMLFVTVGVRVCPICHGQVDSTNVCHTCGAVLFDRSPQMFSHNHPDYMCPVCKGLGVEMQIDEGLIIEHPERSLLDKASSFYGDLRKHRKKPNANWMRGEILALAEAMGVDLDVPYKALPKAFKEQVLYGTGQREVSLAYKNANGRSGLITRPVEGAVHIIQRLAQESKSKTGLDNLKKYMTKKTCSRCQGERLLEEGRLVHIGGTRYPELMTMSMDHARQWCHSAYKQMSAEDRQKTLALLQKIHRRLLRIDNVGLSYISLDRSIPSLSGGEAQRLKLATQFGTGLSNILYIMDEPSKGLHPRDYVFLMEAILDLKHCGNTIVIVEHKKQFKQIADNHITMGPKAGKYGGEILSIDRKEEMVIEDYPEEDYRVNKEGATSSEFIHMRGVETNNLKNVSVDIPIGMMTAVIGVSGSGKSSLISKTLLPYIDRHLGRLVEEQGLCAEISGIDGIHLVSYVNQKPIGSNSRSNPATYTGVFDSIRKSYSKLETSIERGYGKEWFSFNAKKGQCPDCKGLGAIAVNMHYMDDVYVACNTCHGKRYKQGVLEVKRKGYSIADLLEMEISDVMPLFEDEPEIYEQLLMLDKVGLAYLSLGQSASTLSGGEAQRIKLAKELYNKTCNGVLYILDEPTTGLHDADTRKVIHVLKELEEKGATIILISHNSQLIKACGYLIELGPSGGHAGGRIIREGYLLA